MTGGDAAVRVLCLPVAGVENPYQKLMMQGLREAGLQVSHGADGRWFAVFRTLLRTRPDYLHFDWIDRYYLHRSRILTWLHALLFFLEVMMARALTGTRIVWTLHNLRPHDTQDRRRPVDFAQRRFAGMCQWIRVFQPSSIPRASEALGLSAARFRCVPEGSYVGYYPAAVGREQARERFGFVSSDFVLLYLGAMRPYKGLEELVEGFERVACDDWTLLLAGPTHDEAYAHALQRRANGASGVRIEPGFVANDQLQFYFAAADVVVLPFMSVENSGSTVLAMGFGKPVLAPAKGVLPERLVRQRRLLYDGDIESGLRILRSMDRAMLERAGLENRQEVQQYRWSDFGRAFRTDPDTVPAQ